MGSFQIKGLDNLEMEFKKLSDNVQNLSDQTEIPFSELFNRSFMKRYTSFNSFDELLDAGGFHVESDKDFEAIPDKPFDAHIAATTRFRSWDAMLEKATELYLKKKLDF